MEKSRYLAINIILAVIACNGCAAATAATAQWFPVSGTTTDYTASVLISFTNGTKSAYSLFNVFGNSSIPTMCQAQYFWHYGNLTYPTIAPGVEIKMRHVYTELNSTHMNRTTAFLFGNIVTNTTSVNFIYSRGTSFVISRTFFQNAGIPVRKDGFMDEQAGETFDHINNLAVIGDVVGTRYHVQAITREGEEILSYYDAIAQANETYITDSSGKVLSFQVATNWGIVNSEIATAEILFEVSSTSSMPVIFESPVEWAVVIALAAVVVVLATLLARKRKSK
nr:hypothetical protein [Candidatus Sigynarchaeota archaeon]